MFSRNLRSINTNFLNLIQQPAGSSISPRLTIDPSVLAGLLGNLPVSTGTGAPSGTGVSTPGPSSNLPANLQSLLSMLQLVNDGDVIASNDFNLHTLILLAIANLLGATPVSGGETTVTYMPNFFQNDTGPNWAKSNGVASPPSGGTAKGWLPVQFPAGVHIESMTVRGRKNGNVALFAVALVRQAIADSSSVITLIPVNLQTAGDPFTKTGLVSIPQAGPATVEEYSTVDTSLYKYFVTAEVDNAANIATIDTIQLTYRQ
ncbi:MAG TPA: hypothetical protein VFA10_29600 [Ktedonobacteraceae bacterium]|nr:hypothetical protein [Ktedonobacteraceae bacterium]